MHVSGRWPPRCLRAAASAAQSAGCCALVLLLLTSCSAASPPGTSPAAASDQGRLSHRTSASGPPTATPPLADAPASRQTASTDPNRTGEPPGGAALPPERNAAGPDAGASASDAGGVNYGDPLAVTAAYVAARWKYTYSDPAGCAAALTAPELTTPSFAARSAPGPAALSQLAAAQESSTVTVLSAAPSWEAPGTDSTRYVTARFAVTSTYTGAGSGFARVHIWSLRLRRADGQWRVDGVVVAG